MKRILIALLLSIVIVTPCLAEAPSSTAAPSSAADEFLTNLSATWNSLVKLGEETANNVVNWVNNDLDNWLKNDLPAWADNAANSIQSWIGEADKWTQDAAAKLQADSAVSIDLPEEVTDYRPKKKKLENTQPFTL